MNILIDLRPLINAKISGVTVYMSNLAHELLRVDRKNNYYFYLNCFSEVDVDRKLFRKFKIVRTKIPNKLLNISMSLLRWPKIDKLVSKKIAKKIDVCFFMDPRPAPVSKNIKKIITFHDLSFQRYPQNFSFFTRIWHKILRPKKEAREASSIIAVSEFTANELQNLYQIDPQKISIVYHGISRKFKIKKNQEELSKIKEKYALNHNFILSVSTLEPRKNLQNLIKAVELLNTKFPESPFDLVIVGRKNLKVFRDPLIEHKSFIKFLGHISFEDKVKLYNCASVYSCLSFYEGFCFPLLEAMKCGCPVVSANSAAIPEIVKDYAYLVDPFDIDTIAKGLEMAILKGKKDSIINQAREHSKKFRWRVCAEKTIKVFENDPLPCHQKQNHIHHCPR